jgi:N-hydroxyarylamine O-acetyltransferase
MDVRRYLERIDADRSPSAEPTLDNLAHLQRCHLRAVPFENLDVVAGRPIPIDRQTHYEKVVEAGRGGFCYELNGLFDWLLGALGFETRFVEAQVLIEGAFSRRYAHAAVLVDLGADGPPETRDGWYLVDVGFGDFARQPLPLTGGPRTDISGTYRVRALDDGRFESQYRGSRAGEDDPALGPDEWTTRYRLTPADRDGAAFEPACEWTQTSPDSPFTGRLVCSLATADGRLTLSEHALTVTAGGEKTKQAVAPDVRHAVISDRFGLDIDDPLRLPDERPA